MSIRSEIMEERTGWRRTLGAKEWCSCCGWTFTGCEWATKEHDYLCELCKVTVVGRGFERPLNVKASELWCHPCLEKIKNTNSIVSIVTNEIDKERHDQLMREAQE